MIDELKQGNDKSRWSMIHVLYATYAEPTAERLSLMQAYRRELLAHAEAITSLILKRPGGAGADARVVAAAGRRLLRSVGLPSRKADGLVALIETGLAAKYQSMRHPGGAAS